MNYKKNDAYMKALANEHRLKVIEILLDGEVKVGDLNKEINLSQSALSQHLSYMRREEVVKSRRVSQTIYYSLNEDFPTREIFDILKKV